ncbi:MAG: sigma-54-dependent Fis family transcriptional regulator [Candidatus Delongbacteria bacterium]|nr:sigma-54-dependent Fis family transcriptional regulator [Candidatus Delongbacteria bacterium]MBN2836888.1 sigma-54-dependent Fis family transcriptional regulator [Candidatus Delongbacteria bacterium]
MESVFNLEKTNEINGKNILIVDDNKEILFTLKLLLKKYDHNSFGISNPSEILNVLNKNQIDLILLDMNFNRDSISGEEGFFWLKKIKESDPSIPVVLITAYADVEKAVQGLKLGAVDFIEKPWNNDRLMITINNALKFRESELENLKLKSSKIELNQQIEKQFNDIIGESEIMKHVFKTIEKVAATDASVLILGENGTGKELVARALHRMSFRKDEIFVSVDMGSITDTLFETEMFGHIKGAFTDAKNDRIGRFETANNGTLFLDEIGNLSTQIQSKLLTAIEKREITRVGTNRTIPTNIRLICATNCNLYQMVDKGVFREDLLYRINTVEIILPPLRERDGDIRLLADYFLKKFSNKYNKDIIKITENGYDSLHTYHWPGNIREFSHAIERAVILSEGEVLDSCDFNFSKAAKNDSQMIESNLEVLEKKTILTVLKKYNGNISKAAKELGLTRTSLYRRMEKHGL